MSGFIIDDLVLELIRENGIRPTDDILIIAKKLKFGLEEDSRTYIKKDNEKPIIVLSKENMGNKEVFLELLGYLILKMHYLLNQNIFEISKYSQAYFARSFLIPKDAVYECLAD